MARDPLKVARARLLEDGVTEEQIAAVESATTSLLEQAVQEALAAPYPDPAQDRGTEFSA
jgi:TPP-dependent pyruvate/acetoin dehydrogenase alpha subunit